MALVASGITLCILLASVLGENNTRADQAEATGYPPGDSSVRDITFTTSAAPLARDLAPYEGEYSLPARDYGEPARDYGLPARDYGAPGRGYGAPATEYGAPGRGYGAPATEYGAPGRGYGAPATEYGAPGRGYGVPATEYGAPGRGYSPPSYGYGPSPSFQRFAPPVRTVPPAAEYVPPSAPSGGFPPSGPSPPGLFPPPGAIPPPFPLYDMPTDYAAYEVIKTRLYTLFEPAAVLVVGVTIFVVIRHYVLPYLIYWARSLEEDLEEERTLGDTATRNILRAATRGACLGRISCELGMSARNFTITDMAISAIEEERDPPRLAVIFRDSASGRTQSCQPYFCKRKPQPSTAESTVKHRRRKRNLQKLY